MRNITIKRIAISASIISLLSTINFIYMNISMWEFIRMYQIKLILKNLELLHLCLTGLSSLGIFISSFGLYKIKKWGYFFTYTCLVVFLFSYLLILLRYFFPNLLNATIAEGNNWFFFFHVNFTIENAVLVILSCILLLVLNLKSTKLIFNQKNCTTIQ